MVEFPLTKQIFISQIKKDDADIVSADGSSCLNNAIFQKGTSYSA